MGLGDTQVDPATARFDMDSQADMLLAFADAHGWERFALVAHDQGGAAAQILATRFPDRVAALVLTDCVCYDNWPVPAVRRLQGVLRRKLLSRLLMRPRLLEWLQTSTPLSDLRRGVLDPSKLSEASIREYLRPLRSSPERRDAFVAFFLAGHPRYTELVVEGLRRFASPTLIVWAADDVFLSPSWGRRLFEDIRGAERFELVPFCGHFWQEEKPAEFSAHIGAFLADVWARQEARGGEREAQGDGSRDDTGGGREATEEEGWAAPASS
jgi:pimeloyl-ACP methyl ester carboxylesterase